MIDEKYPETYKINLTTEELFLPTTYAKKKKKNQVYLFDFYFNFNRFKGPVIYVDNNWNNYS